MVNSHFDPPFGASRVCDLAWKRCRESRDVPRASGSTSCSSWGTSARKLGSEPPLAFRARSAVRAGDAHRRGAFLWRLPPSAPTPPAGDVSASGSSWQRRQRCLAFGERRQKGRAVLATRPPGLPARAQSRAISVSRRGGLLLRGVLLRGVPRRRRHGSRVPCGRPSPCPVHGNSRSARARLCRWQPGLWRTMHRPY